MLGKAKTLLSILIYPWAKKTASRHSSLYFDHQERGILEGFEVWSCTGWEVCSCYTGSELSPLCLYQRNLIDSGVKSRGGERGCWGDQTLTQNYSSCKVLLQHDAGAMLGSSGSAGESRQPKNVPTWVICRVCRFLLWSLAPCFLFPSSLRQHWVIYVTHWPRWKVFPRRLRTGSSGRWGFDAGRTNAGDVTAPVPDIWYAADFNNAIAHLQQMSPGGAAILIVREGEKG